MSQQWCNKYRQLCIKAEALQRECSQIQNRLSESPLLPSNGKKGRRSTAAGSILRKKTQCDEIKMENCNYVSFKTDFQQDKKVLEEKICCLHQHCVTIKDTLCLVLSEKKNTTERRKKFKQICQKAVERYEDQYERLRCLCDDEVTRLETKSVELFQSLQCIDGT